MTRRLLPALLFLLLSPMTLTPAPSTAAKDELTVVQGTEVTTLDSQLTQGIDGIAIVRHLFNGLVFIDAKGEIVPDLAERWEVAANQATWTFHLRKGVKFHDGSRSTPRRRASPSSAPSDPARRPRSRNAT